MFRRALAGSATLLASRGLTAAAQFGALLVLARLLDESDFGLAWMAAVIVGVAGVGADLGMEVLVVQRRDVDDARAARISEFAGLGTFLLVAALAPLAARAFGSPPGLVDLVLAGGASLIFTGYAMPARGRLRRELRFTRLAGVDIVRALAVAAGSIGFAAGGFGAWAIVLGDLSGAGIGAALAWLVAPAMRPGADRRLVRDGARIVGTRAADAGFAQADRFFVGSRLGAAALGYYGFAWRHAMLLVGNLLPIADQVALPVLARLRDDQEELRKAYLSLTRLLALAIIPGAALLHAIAPWLVDLLYPDRWQAAVPALRALCVAAAAAGLNSDPGLLWMALGKMRLRLRWSLVNLLAVVAVVWIGTRHGVVGVAWALALRSLLATIAAQIITRRVAGVAHRDYARAVLPGLALGALVFLLA